MKFKIALAFLSIYLIWGSTYLAIALAVTTLPPLTLSALRFFLAALLMEALALSKKEKSLTARESRISLISGALLISANGFVCIAEKYIASGVVAVVIGTMPIWILILSWIFFQSGKPSLLKVVGSLIGCIGVALIAQDSLTGSSSFHYSVLFLPLSCLLWSLGTLAQKSLVAVKSPLKFSALQMAGGFMTVLLLSILFEHPWSIQWNSISLTSWWALGYLVFLGSIIGFTSYSWLSRNVSPHLVSTYALVNPIIAVALGVTLNNESLSSNLLVGTLIIIFGLSLLIFKPKKRA